MKIELSFKDDKSNPTEVAVAFIEHWLTKNGFSEDLAEVVSPEQLLNGGPDYFVPRIGLLIEAAKLVGRKGRQERDRRCGSGGRLGKVIGRHGRFSEIKGRYSIETPEVFGLSSNALKSKSIDEKLDKAADELIEAILSGKKKASILKAEVRIMKISQDGCGVYFRPPTKIGAVDVDGVFHSNDKIKEKIKWANYQLNISEIEGIAVESKVLLIANEDRRCLPGPESVGEGRDVYENIDEVWLQVWQKGEDCEFVLYQKDRQKNGDVFVRAT